MSNCNKCRQPAGSCGCNQYRNPNYSGRHSANVGNVNYNNFYYPTQPEHPCPCGDNPCGCDNDECGPEYKVTGPARPLTYGSFQTRYQDGRIAPYANVLVTFHRTSTKVTIYSHPDKRPNHIISNPAKSDSMGRVNIYFSGGPVDVLVTDNCGKTIDEFENYGGYVDDDFRVDQIEQKNCIDIENPLIKIHDGDKCNLPDSFVRPGDIVMQGLIDNDMPVGDWEAVVDYYCCLGEIPPTGLKVVGHDGCIYEIRDDEECDELDCICSQEEIKDPSEYEYDADGLSEDTCLWQKECCCIGTALDDVVRTSSVTAGGGVCVDVSATEDFIWQSRDGEIIEGDATINQIGTSVGALELTVINPYDYPALLDIDFSVVGDCYRSPIGDESIVWALSDSEDISFPDNSVLKYQQTLGESYVFASVPEQVGLINDFDALVRMVTNSTNAKYIIEPGETKKISGQYWFVARNVTGGTQVFHGNMIMRPTLTQGVKDISDPVSKAQPKKMFSLLSQDSNVRYYLTGSKNIWPGITGYIEYETPYFKIAYKNKENLFMPKEVSKKEYYETLKRRDLRLSDKAIQSNKLAYQEDISKKIDLKK